MLNLRVKRINHTYLLVLVLVLSGFTHLWNATGFPDIFFDEGVYMRRAMHVLSGLGPQEAYFYDHPFFGQIFLAGVLGITGYPSSLNPSTDTHSIEMLYLIPRIIMGLLVIFDTFLIYKITEKKYDRTIGFVAAILFAVMPITWILRRILLDSILLPFLLSSILMAIYSRDSKNKTILVLFSGFLLGLAIFTKIPAAIMIPLVATLIYHKGNNNNLKFIGLWLIPVILLPLIWPIQSISADHFDLWIRDVFGQTQRHSGGLPLISGIFFIVDPVLFILGIGGIIYAGIRRNFFILIWFLPYIIFLAFIGFTQYFYWIPILPIFCIATAILLVKNLKNIFKGKTQNIVLVTISGIAIFGLVSTTMLITTNITNTQFQATAFTLKQVQSNDTTILAGPQYSWIFYYVFDKKNVEPDYSALLYYPVQTKKLLLIADPHFMIDIPRGRQLQDIYNATNKIASFDGEVLDYDHLKYPYTSMIENREASHIEIRTK